MTETRLKELQTEIARLEALDNKITNRVNNEFTLAETKNYIKAERAKLVYNDDGTVDYNNNEFENEDDGGMSFEDAHTNHDIVIECSANLDQAMQYESE